MTAMASNTECVGLRVSGDDELSSLLEAAFVRSRLLASHEGGEIRAWQDPSGARLVLILKDRQIVGFLPSFDGTPGARLARTVPVRPDVATAAVLDADGDQATPLARLSGAVVSAEVRTVELTGQEFKVARLRTAGFECDLCLASREHPELIAKGMVLSGEVFLVGRLDHPPVSTATPRGWRRWTKRGQ